MLGWRKSNKSNICRPKDTTDVEYFSVLDFTALDIFFAINLGKIYHDEPLPAFSNRYRSKSALNRNFR
jgi:hypothetical protein